MLTSNSSTPVKTSADSPDTLPIRGYTCDQLSNYIIRQLGGPVWNVELSKQMILDCIQDSLGLYSQWVPNLKVGNVVMVRGQFKYLQGQDMGLGIIQIDFVEPNPVPTEIFYMGTSLTRLPCFVLDWMSTILSFVGAKLGHV